MNKKINKMKKQINLNLIILFIISGILFSSCATIIGGSKYYAKVQVPDHPNAKIEYKGDYKGTGEASFKVKRREANQFSITVKEKGCETQTTDFTQRTFRGWAFAGSLLGWTGLYQGVPLPWGIVVDASTGAWWKPDINEKGVTKQDYNHYIYRINYTGCKEKKENFQTQNKTNVPQQKIIKLYAKSKADRLRELKQLLDEKIITQEEFKKEKKKILDE